MNEPCSGAVLSSGDGLWQGRNGVQSECALVGPGSGAACFSAVHAGPLTQQFCPNDSKSPGGRATGQPAVPGQSSGFPCLRVPAYPGHVGQGLLVTGKPGTAGKQSTLPTPGSIYVQTWLRLYLQQRYDVASVFHRSGSLLAVLLNSSGTLLGRHNNPLPQGREPLGLTSLLQGVLRP